MSDIMKARQACALAVTLLALAPVTGLCETPVILPQANGRIWQTVFDTSAPLEWRWAAGAASATVTVTNALFGTVEGPTAVARVANAKYGSVAMPNPARRADTGEGLVDVVLAQLDGDGNELSVETARLAFLPGSAGGAFGVNEKTAMASPRVVPYDAAWTNASVLSVGYALTPAGGTPGSVPLAGTSGYFPLAAVDGTVELDFDGTAYAVAFLRKWRGFSISFR